MVSLWLLIVHNNSIVVCSITVGFPPILYCDCHHGGTEPVTESHVEFPLKKTLNAFDTVNLPRIHPLPSGGKYVEAFINE